MARPFKRRKVCQMPSTLCFGPCNSNEAEIIEMTIDEYEVIRLIDYLNLTQTECAMQMDVARTTVQSIYDSARKKIGRAFVEGKKIVFQGGSYFICQESSDCCGKYCMRNLCSDNFSNSDCCSKCNNNKCKE